VIQELIEKVQRFNYEEKFSLIEKQIQIVQEKVVEFEMQREEGYTEDNELV
jgi:hypothetical protein